MAKEELALDQTHRDYNRVNAVRVMSSHLFAGEHVVKAQKKTYLYQNETESAKAYERRWKRAYYDNWLLPGILARMSLIWEKMPTREKFGAIDLFIKDVDGRETTSDVFMMGVTEAALVEGLRWVLVDKTAPPDQLRGTELSLQQEKDFKIRPYFRSIPGCAVLDWDIGNDRQLLWAVVAQSREQKPGPGLGSLLVPQRMVWTRKEWVLYEPPESALREMTSRQKINYLRKTGLDPETVQVNPSGSWVEVRRGMHPLNAVPLVPFYGIFESDFVGWPVTKDILGHCIAIYNKASDRDNAEFKTNSPVPYVIAEKNPERLTVASENGIFLPPTKDVPNPSIAYLEHTGAGIQAGRESERDLIKRIFEIQLQSMKGDTRQVQSANSLKQESKLFHASMSMTSSRFEMSEVQCWRLWWRWQAASGDFPGTVVYQKDFSDQLIDEAMIRSLSDMVERLQLSRKTLLEILQGKEVLPPSVNVQSELTQIESDQETFAMPGFGQATPPGQEDEDEDPEAGDEE